MFELSGYMVTNIKKTQYLQWFEGVTEDVTEKAFVTQFRLQSPVFQLTTSAPTVYCALRSVEEGLFQGISVTLKR